MSALLSIRTADRVTLFTDGASYDDAGYLRDINTKVRRARSAPFAITTLGNAKVGDLISQIIIREVERVGVDDFFDRSLALLLAEFRSEPSIARTHIFAHIAAWHKDVGALHTCFQTVAEDDIEPFLLRELSVMAHRGPTFDLEKLANLAPSEGGDMVREVGVYTMELMRHSPGVPVYLEGTHAKPRYLVGGHIDMTTIDDQGARTERVHTWPDKIGELIDPFRLREIK